MQMVQMDKRNTQHTTPFTVSLNEHAVIAIGTAQHNPAQFDVTADSLRSLIAAIATVEGQVMAGNGLRNCYEQSYGEIDDDKHFAARMRAIIVEMYNHWEKAAEGDMPDKHRLMVIISLFVFFHLHFPSKDTKLPKLIWKSHKKANPMFPLGICPTKVCVLAACNIVAFHLVGDILWIPCEFLMREVPSIVDVVDKKSIQFIRHVRETFYVEHCDAMLEEAISKISAAEEWQLKLFSPTLPTTRCAPKIVVLNREMPLQAWWWQK
ncbi:hypothetical protein NECAME_04117 [Necator americanus]|uniref:WASH complex subunit 4 N-terminal domain-containing protein n=1 Tax=Necator americanus TaxID=51031 RepID=W2SZX5_NECAM|nr:hypothetical protein NECAME_04117 [Necator americanus]ETN74252.1 hypothetical protein NECAME_04117 [Necator americanus]